MRFFQESRVFFRSTCVYYSFSIFDWLCFNIEIGMSENIELSCNLKDRRFM